MARTRTATPESDVQEHQHVLVAREPQVDGPLEQIVGAIDPVAEHELRRDGDQHRPVQQPGDGVVARLPGLR